MQKDILKMTLEISTDTGSVLRPIEIKLSSAKPTHPESAPNAPFKYYTDAIIGLCYHKLTDFKFVEPSQKSFVEAAYQELNPYVELYRKSMPRVQSMTKVKPEKVLQVENFEKNMTDVWTTVFKNGSVDFSQVQKVLNLVSDFENQLGSPFLYNFSLQFSDRFRDKLTAFYAFLFHLRSVVAIDHNAYVEDSSLESVKCDSISDYLPKSDYTTNDALLFLQFKKLTTPFISHKDKDVRIEKLLVQPLQNAFYQYNHNACCLIDQLPPSLLNSLSPVELEETLHHVQMDWLLGSPSGMLFKVREELFGLVEGYDHVFWPETLILKPKPGSKLQLGFQISSHDLATESTAA
ncbi:MAG: hypothetical protein A2622_00750 [Bdellovibrionales bacterium RIFCSPHIGHO2_01_FULL_40_29]|nr:MAG: hypothetical protein A2622_00750 [Bdellovibrionales bacterium RIFCSPHIGHO2_01_FULL_40_29]OFZ32648.1 MAG: hypothetical protein A3D17_05350 [Bdellovibrionales bacterium RIFCSPHIGHO2_02_FULL_40_15]